MPPNSKGRSGFNQATPKSPKNTLNFTGYAAHGKVAVDIPELLILVPVYTPRYMSDFSNLIMAAVWRWV